MSFTHRLAVVCLAAALAIGSLFSQEPLTNEGVIKLVKSGLSEALILNVISAQASSFKLGADDLVALKTNGVSERIISAMVAHSTGAPAAAAAPTPAAAPAKPASAASAADALKEGGVYYKKGPEYLEVLTEEVAWETKGAIKSVATVGFVKKDLHGSVTGPSSRNYIQIPGDIVIAPPRGMSINNYVLLPLHSEKGERKFEVGPVNQKNGVAKGAIPFGVEKIGANAFRMVFQSALGPGEYGVLTTNSIGGSEQLTRMYTFRLML